MQRFFLIIAILLSTLRIAAQDNKPEIIWGYYMGAAFESLGGSEPGDWGMGIYVPGSKELAGSTMIGAWIPICTLQGHTTNVKLWGGTKPGATDIFSKTCKDEELYQGYNCVYLDQPITIPTEGLYVGMTFTIPAITSSYDLAPLGVVQGHADGSLYLLEKGQWQDYSQVAFPMGDGTSAHFMSAFEVILNDVNLPHHSADAVRATDSSLSAGGNAQSVLTLASSSYGVNSIDYSVDCEGILSTGSVELKPVMRPGFNRTGQATIAFSAPTTPGQHMATVTVTKVNGEPNESSHSSTNCKVSVVSRSVPRLSVVEENTGTGCGWCPRGWVGMEKVKKNLSDKAAVIAIHQYNMDDPMFPTDGYARVPFTGAPQCAIDRRTYPEPYYGEGTEGIEAAVLKYNNFLPEVAITANAHYADDKHDNVVIEAETEFLIDGEGYTIAYVLTADGLTGTSSAWKQTNYYPAEVDAEDLPADLAPFGRGGAQGQDKVSLTYDDVLIASSWTTDGTNQAAAFAGSTATGSTAKTTHTLSLPTRDALRRALQFDRVYATVIVFTKDGLVANAARCRVLASDDTRGLTMPHTETGLSTPICTYDLQGRKHLRQPQRGLYLQGGTKMIR